MTKLAHLHWTGTKRPFARPTIYLDLSKLQATPETVAAIFGVSKPDAIALALAQKDREHHDDLELFENVWPLEAEKHYDVRVRLEDATVPDVTIKDLHQTVGGTERIRQLSLNFYNRVWHDTETPESFRSVFQANKASEPELHAHHQSSWFSEIWGGPKLYSEEHGQGTLLPRMLKKHTQSRMSYDHAISWLRTMKAATDDEFGGDPKIQHALGLYWLHFFGFFPFDDQQRAEFRRIVFSHEQKNW